jgi:PKD repeat protein
LSYSWDFGDGKKSTQTAQQNPTHTYTNNGTWDVTLTVSDGSNYSTTVFEGYIVSGTGSVIEELLLPEYFTLHQNYPNPFNPTTTISYDLPEQALVTLGIYDILGKQIKTLVNQSQDVGYKIVVWDGTDNLGRQMSAGVYLYQIEAGGFIQTRKMLYLK